ncbi:MAG: metabolite traffic protein EboE [Phycisphaerales bacterium]|nr:metabolite traffic protein EboE [Phycisphaerales bacterium]
MTDSSPARRLGYCTNVHAGDSFHEAMSNLREYAPRVAEALDLSSPLPVGLWLSRQALTDAQGIDIQCLRDELDQIGVAPFTMNAFPYGNFHQAIVKHDVYQPDWSTRERGQYTLELAELFIQLIPSGTTAGLSTLPVSWAGISPLAMESAVENLLEVCTGLARLEGEYGTCLHLDLEPEPGCLLQRSADVVSLFEDHLLTNGMEDRVRRHLRVCHDTCHASVMFESQKEVIQTYDQAGISIGKVQVSSAIQVRGPLTEAMVDDLKAFAEPRWLHQTCRHDGNTVNFHDDLSIALESGPLGTDEIMRIHFHVPVHLDHIGELETTQDDLLEAIRLLARRETLTDWEVETYAWGALPTRFEVQDLASGIADEIRWTRAMLEQAS